MECTTDINITEQNSTTALACMSYKLCCTSSAELNVGWYIANLYQSVICCHICSYENLAFLCSKNTFHRTELATHELLKQSKFSASETKTCLQNRLIQDISKENAKKEKKIIFILSLIKNTCTMIHTACVCEMCFLHQ